MPGRYLPRALEPALKKAAREFPAVVLTGPRQSGKTTLLKHAFGRTHGYVSLDVPDVRLAALSDPRGFLEYRSPPVIFDEIQYAPQLLSYLKEDIDSRRSKKNQYILTGSQNLLMMESVTETLAGRAAVLRLLPLTRREMISEKPSRPFWRVHRQRELTERPSKTDIWKQFLRGGYPELSAEPNRDAPFWYGAYLQTYLERDVRSLRHIGDLGQFQSFLRLLAARSGQLLNITDMARDLGLAVNTIKSWISVLEASHQVFILRPYFANIGKRLVKMPKIYFTDVGLLCYLVGLRDPAHAAAGPMGGAIFETAVLLEIVKIFINSGMEPRVYFWRTSTGEEVDIIIEADGLLIPVEVKMTSTPRPEMTASLRSFMKYFPKLAPRGYLVHSGNMRQPLMPGIKALPFSEL